MAPPLDRHTRGVFIIAATPFDDTGAVDLDSLDRLVDFYAETGVTGLTILGMMGEADKLTGEERIQVIDRVLARTALPVVVGVSDPGLRNLTALGRHAMDRGSAGLMVAPTRGPARDDRVEAYVHAVAGGLGPEVPLVFQDFPLATDVPVSAGLIRRLSTDLPQMVMLKHEDWPGLSKISALRAQEQDGAVPRLSILCGNGGLYLPQELARGADGAMTGFAYPEALSGRSNCFTRAVPTPPRIFRPLSATAAPRTAARMGPCRAQAHPDGAGRDPLRRHPRARSPADPGRHCRTGTADDAY